MARPPVARSSPAMLATSLGFVGYSRFSACSLRRRFGCDTLNGYPVTLVDAHNIIFSRMRTYQSYIMSVNQRYRRVFPRVWWDRSGFRPRCGVLRGVLLAGVDARRTWRPSRGVRGAAVTATTAGVDAVPCRERRQIRCLIVFARTRTHREGILTPGRRLGQRPAAPPGPEIHHQRQASILFQPRDLSGVSPSGCHVSMPAPG